MPPALHATTLGDLPDVLDAMRVWPRDGEPVPLHVGDLGWNHRFGAEATAAAVWTWRRDGTVVAVGFGDAPGLMRLAVAPGEQDDDELAARMATDLGDPAGTLLPGDGAAVELRAGAALRTRLTAAGWRPDESWTPLVRDLSGPVEAPDVRIETVGPGLVAERVAVQRASFATSAFTVEGWHAMAAGPAYADARCLLAVDAAGTAVATATVWSAGVGRPGLLEPVGTHREHRGRGHGRAITLGAAAALRELGASSATVCTPTANTGAIATYRSAGFTALPEVRDLRRPT